ncbi:MAG: M3 family oligoendopeptidase [bacterium]
MTDRTEISGPTWELASEYKSVDDPRLQADLDALDAVFAEVEALNEQLSGSDAIRTAQQIAVRSEHAGNLLGNVQTYANCLVSVDSQHEGALKLTGSLQRYHKRFGDCFEPLAQFVDAASDEEIEQYLDHPEVQALAFQVHHGRKRRHENLTLAQESLVNGLSQDGLHAWGQLYNQLSSTMSCTVMVGNEQQTMGVASANKLLMDVSEPQREAAWRGISEAWQSQEQSCAAAINAIAGWRLEMCKQRSHERPVHFLDAPTHASRLTRKTLETLLEVSETNKVESQRATALMARAYGKETFAPWDVVAPAPVIGAGSNPPLAFDEAVDIIAEAYGEVDGQMADFVRMMVRNNWIEGSVGPRKRPGAYATTFSKSRHQRVYMTYTGGQLDVVTLAHELGHAFHSHVMRELPDSQRSYGMSLAETASTFGEALVRDALLARATSPQEKLNIIWEELRAHTGFMLNIPTRFEFENKLYEARQQRPQQPEELKALMRSAWRNWYGEGLAEPDEMFWASKLHFYISGLSFYNFPYLFGYLFSSGVYTRRHTGGADFYAKYVALLCDTGRMTAEDLARQHLDADLEQPGFWQDTIDSFTPRIDVFENLLDELGVEAH